MTDVDGRLRLNGRDIPLAAPVRTRLAAWLLPQPDLAEHGQPAPADQPTHCTAPRPRRPLLPLERQRRPTQSPARGPHPPRDPRPGGDVRRISDLFGLSVEGATRHLNTIEHPDLHHGQSEMQEPAHTRLVGASQGG